MGEEEKKQSELKSELRKCYGAYSSLQSQLHHITGCIEEIHSYMQIIESAFEDMKSSIERFFDGKSKENIINTTSEQDSGINKRETENT